MKKSTKTITIDEKEYTLHSTKASGTGAAIGSVPVLLADDIADYVDVYDMKTIISCLRSGLAVNLQAKARRACSSDGITPNDFNRIASALLTEDATRYAGNFAQLKIDVYAEYENEGSEQTFDADKVWTEYCNG